MAQTDGDDPFKELREELSRLREINPTEYEMTSDEFLGLDDNVCTTEEHPITDEEILSSLVSNADDDDGEKGNDVVEENDVPPNRPTTEELEEAISAILRAALYSSEHGLQMRTLALQCENVFTKARIQRMKQKSISDYYCI